MQLEFKADGCKWQADNTGCYLCIPVPSPGHAGRILDGLEPGKEYTAEIKRKRQHRSLDANAYFWVLLDRLAAALQVKKTELYRHYIREVGGNCYHLALQDKAVETFRRHWESHGTGWVITTQPSKLDGCTTVCAYYGSSEYDTEQMARLIDLVVQDCHQVGVETKSPEELASLMEQWNEKKDKRAADQ